MSELAVNQYGETFLVTQDATHWMVRRMADVARGGPQATFDAEGRPIVIPIETTLAQFHQILRDHGCTPGKYRLDPVDRAGRPVKGTAAYLPFPPGRKSAPVARAEEGAEGERPRNGNAPSMPAVMPSAGWSTGGAFPLPVPAHLTGTEYLLGEALRGQIAMTAIQAQAHAQVIGQLVGQMSGVMTAAAELLRAADGASLPKRRPMAEREAARVPQVIVQQVAPPVAYDDELDDDDDGEEPVPAKPAAWTDKIGDVFTELAPMAKMMIQSKLADVVGGGGDGGLGAILGGMMPGAGNATPRNAAPVVQPIVEVEVDEEPEIDPTPEALAHLARVIAQLGNQPAGRALRDELRHMDAEARVGFALELLALPLDEACEEAVCKVAAIRVRRSRAMMAAERARGGEVTTREYDGSELVSIDDVPADAAVAKAPTYSSTTEEPDGAIATPGYEHVRTQTGPNGHRVSHYRAAPRPATPGTAALDASVSALLRSLQTGGDAAVASLIGSFPGGASGIEAALTQVSPELAAQLSAALGAAASSSNAQNLPAAPVSNAAAMARMMDILPLLSAAESAAAPTIAASLPGEMRAQLMAKLVAAPLGDAVAMVKEIVATYAAHGNPQR